MPRHKRRGEAVAVMVASNTPARLAPRDGSPLDASAVTEYRDEFLRAAIDQLP
jgi:hypothetical protein